MLLSLFTPTHDPRYLLDAYRSLLAQSHEAFEWILVPNALPGRPLPEIPARIRQDPRVRVIPYAGAHPERIGALKRFCCEQARGEALVELDHDDLLVPGILGELARCLAAGAGFVYSDVALFLDDERMTPHGFHGDYGWESYECRVYGRPFLATRGFPLTPRSLCEIRFAPDHIRCWSREAYRRAGGHDPRLAVGDDHELILRTYLQGIPFRHTGTVGYLYRSHPRNTIRARAEAIEAQQSRNRDKYLYPLIDEWLRRTGYGYVDLARELQPGPRIAREDGTVGCVRAYDVLHRVAEPQRLMEEIYRVLVPGGWLCARFPSTSGSGAFTPVAKSYWNLHTFDYYTDRRFARQIPGNRVRFQLVRAGEYFPDEFARSRNIRYGYADLCALKGQRQPGPVQV